MANKFIKQFFFWIVLNNANKAVYTERIYLFDQLKKWLIYHPPTVIRINSDDVVLKFNSITELKLIDFC